MVNEYGSEKSSSSLVAALALLHYSHPSIPILTMGDVYSPLPDITQHAISPPVEMFNN